tara:strand:+ start:201 stop:1607 length:1407 start_codon:yes stop_codon:yes gene_type:complete
MTITLSFKKKLDRHNRDSIRYYVVHSDNSGELKRNYINTGIKVLVKDVDSRNWRVKATASSQKELNVALSKAKENIDTALTRFEISQFTYEQVLAFLRGEVAYDSVDSYIDSVIKESRSSTTYQDYKNTLNAFKHHLNIDKSTRVLFREFSSYVLLDKFKRNALNKGLAGTSINSYFNKIRAVLNDAHDKGYIYEKFTLKRGLKVTAKPSKPIQSITSEEFEEAIGKVSSIYDAQALALYLLMFGLRGMYLTDITALKDAEFKHDDFDKKDTYLNIFNDGHKYIIHRRVKTRNRMNDDLVIRLDSMIPLLINITKKLFRITHKGRGLISENKLALFDYDLNDTKLHKNLWDVYQKRIRKVLGFSFKTARKTYNTFATELEVSNTIRDILLGHAPLSINEKHYTNRRTITLSEKVQQSHTEILEDFDFENLSMMLYVKMMSYLSDKEKVIILRMLDSEFKKLKVDKLNN